MGKLTTKEAENLHKEGLLTDETLREMQNTGLVGRRARNERRVMKNKNGGYVTPQLYFRGLSRDGEYSNKMTKFREKFNELVSEYTTTITNKETK
tara:strand:- start:1961 stop:2245 length:285 start_codon:yes stop_codon:yes gene_type:complete